jgi:hypothetical protein
MVIVGWVALAQKMGYLLLDPFLHDYSCVVILALQVYDHYYYYYYTYYQEAEMIILLKWALSSASPCRIL